MFYSKSTQGFYDPEIHDNNIPSDAVEITAEQHSFLLLGQSQGKVIVSDDNGSPILIDTVAPSEDFLKSLCKTEAKKLLVESDFAELPSVRASILNADAFDAYRTTVRALFLNPVANPVWPTRPAADWRV